MATVRWIGNAQAVKQVTTIAVSGTWATSDTATLTINDKNVTVTVGTDVSTSNIADILARAVNGDDDTPNLLNDESRNVNGQEVPEFTEVVASNSGATLTLTSAVAGVPFTVTASESTAGSGALGTPTEATAATGPNFFDNGDNWEGGSAPSLGDTILFDHPSASVYYALGNTTAELNLIRTKGYTGSIGLPRVNANGYSEYRTRFLSLPPTATTGAPTHEIGMTGTATATGYTYLDFGTNDPTTITVLIGDTQAATSDGAAVQIVGGIDLILEVLKGSVSVGEHSAENATTIKRVRQSYLSTQATDVSLFIGRYASFDGSAQSVRVDGGTLTCEADCAGANNEVRIYAGTFLAQPSSTFNDVYIYGGTFQMRGTQFATVSVFGGGTLDLSRVTGSLGITNPVELYHGFTVLDPNNVYGDIYNFNGCTPADGTFTVRDNQSWTPADL